MSEYSAWDRRSSTELRSATRPVPWRGVRIVTDSSSDILPNQARGLGLIVVPNRIILDGQALRDGLDITASQFYAHLPHLRSAPSTIPAAPEDLYSAYGEAFREGASAVISVHVSSRLSKVMQHAQMVKDYLASAPLYVIDSQQIGIGMWPAVIRAAQMARADAPVEDIYEAIVSILARTRLYFMVESLDALRRSGRIGRARQLLGTLLDVHPILAVDQGEMAPVETARPRGQALRRMRDVALAHDAIETVIVCGTSIESIAEMEAVMSERYDGTLHKTWLGPTNGANAGPAIAVAVVEREGGRRSRQVWTTDPTARGDFGVAPGPHPQRRILRQPPSRRELIRRPFPLRDTR